MSKLTLVGEAYGEDEEKAGRPFVGQAGKMLDALLRAAGIAREECDITNVFNERPPENEVLHFFGTKREVEASDYPSFRKSKYLRPEFAHHLATLRERLLPLPDCTVALGATPLWAICGVGGLSRRRGAWHETQRCIPTFHPAYILRQYHWFPLVVSDLWKAKEVSEGRLVVPLFRLEPRPNYQRVMEFLAEGARQQGPVVFDIETSPKFRAITCIGIGHSGVFMCIPLADADSPGFSYWPTAQQELDVLLAIKALLETPGIPKVAHHASYDLTWLWTILGIRVAGPLFDTRLMHHENMAELPHTLGSIAHTFMLLPPWKGLRKESKEEAKGE